jgi:hypothetical protein
LNLLVRISSKGGALGSAGEATLAKGGAVGSAVEATLSGEGEGGSREDKSAAEAMGERVSEEEAVDTERAEVDVSLGEGLLGPREEIIGISGVPESGMLGSGRPNRDARIWVGDETGEIGGDETSGSWPSVKHLRGCLFEFFEEVVLLKILGEDSFDDEALSFFEPVRRFKEFEWECEPSSWLVSSETPSLEDRTEIRITSGESVLRSFSDSEEFSPSLILPGFGAGSLEDIGVAFFFWKGKCFFRPRPLASFDPSLLLFLEDSELFRSSPLELVGLLAGVDFFNRPRSSSPGSSERLWSDSRPDFFKNNPRSLPFDLKSPRSSCCTGFLSEEVPGGAVILNPNNSVNLQTLVTFQKNPRLRVSASSS